MNNKENTYKRIAGTLDYGMKLTVPMIVFCWITIVIGIGTCVAFTVATILENEPLLIIAAVLFPAYFLSIGGYQLIREYKHRKVIKLWCEDAVKLTANISMVYSEEAKKFIHHYDEPNNQYKRSAFPNFFLGKPLIPTILKVRLKYNGEKHVFYSFKRQKTEFDSFFLRGYAYHGKMVTTYGGGKVKVLYSPKYQKVILLKNVKVSFVDNDEDADEDIEVIEEMLDVINNI